MTQDAFVFPPHNRTDTSIRAAASIRVLTPSIRDQVMRFIATYGSATTDEVERGLELSHQTASARVWELRKAQQIIDSGHRRRTRTGRLAIVWRAI